MNTQRQITKLKRENARLQKQIKLLAIGLDVVLCGNLNDEYNDSPGSHSFIDWKSELEFHADHPNSCGSSVWTLLKTL